MSPFPDHFGTTIHASSPGQALPTDPTLLERLIVTLRERGALLLRGHHWSLEQLHTFGQGIAPNPLRYGGSREQVSTDDSIQRAENGCMEISLHSELAFTPLRPDTALFACRVPAARRGQTLVGDGRVVAQMLSPAVRDAFINRRVRYNRRFPASAWQRMFAIFDHEALRARFATLPDFDYELGPNGMLDTSYTTSAFVEDLGGQLAFCNNVSNMVEAEGIPGSTVTFENGDPIEGTLRAELKWALRLERRPVGWVPGDVLVLDNRRVMHGRESFDDPKREIWARFANLHHEGEQVLEVDNKPSSTSAPASSGSGLIR